MNLIAAVRLAWAGLLLRYGAGNGVQDSDVADLGLPGQEYGRRLSKCSDQLARINVRHLFLWACFAITAAAGCITAVASSFAWNLIAWPALAALAVLSLLIRNSREHGRVCLLRGMYESGIGRLRGQWRGQGFDGAEFGKQAQGSLFAADLDLFGMGSLFELLCTARTGVGRTTLANWLLEPADAATITARQTAVSELRDQLDLRQDWASAGNGALSLVESGSLDEWARTTPVRLSFLLRASAVALPLCLLMLLGMAARGVLGANWFLPIGGVLFVETLLALHFRRIRTVSASAEWPAYELSLLVPMLERLEGARFQCSLLTSLQSSLTHLPTRASRRVRSLARLAWFRRLTQTEFALFLAPLLVGTNLAILMERWRQKNRMELTRWLGALGEFEALLCLARHYYENPLSVFPVIRTDSAPLFHAESLAHPLLDPETRISCDLKFDDRGNQLVIVSGSNMSGKSTLLRSVGVNAVLALAGGTVCANSMEISPVRIACCISVHDSLQDNKSRFQAEVERIKAVLETARAADTLFLLDEMLGGTNSQDRLFGAKAIVDQLICSGAIGLITTHDLALTGIANLYERVSNVHYEEHYVDGEMRFDYKMRPGVLTRTNGVNVMAALGLLQIADH